MSRRASAAKVVASAAVTAAVKFADLPGVLPETARALAVGFGYELATPPQALYLPASLAGADVASSRDLLVRASTGSGKTIGFLVPLMQRIAGARLASRSARRSTRPIRALVLSPARELADQTRVQAERLAVALGVQGGGGAKVGVQMVIGGVSVEGERRRLAEAPCDVLVATPGRLLDHIETTPGFAARLAGVRVLVLDEADRLLDAGFADALRRIVARLGADRQTLLFTATVPEGVRSVALAIARPGRLDYIDAASAAFAPPDIAHETRVVPVASLVPELYAAILAARRADPERHKVIVFVPTAKAAAFYSNLFSRPRASRGHSRGAPPLGAVPGNAPATGVGGQKLDQNARGAAGMSGGMSGGAALLFGGRKKGRRHGVAGAGTPPGGVVGPGMGRGPASSVRPAVQSNERWLTLASPPVGSTSRRTTVLTPGTRIHELHSRLSQSQRTRAAEAFRGGSATLLFASDVAARGLDFPDVTHVIQFGIASDAAQVVHRAGRTGRGGKRGEALTLLCDDEAAVLPELAKLGMSPPNTAVAAAAAAVPAPLGAAVRRVATAGDPMREQACAAFVAGLGFYKSNLRRLRWTPEQLVANVTARFAAVGLNPGAAPACKIPGKLGLRVP